MSETNETVHHAFHQAHSFVRSYLAHVERMLRDATARLESASWRFLRHNGERYIGNLDTTADADAWLVDWMHAFYAPAKAFQGKSYGVSAAKAARVAFVGVALREPIPELWLGWVEGYAPKGTLEPELPWFYGLIDPPKLPGVPDPVVALDGLAWSRAAPNEDHPEIRVALERVPLSLIGSASDVERVIDALVAALGG
ncbi:hypothetical protein [Sorangium sp. So ce145]|uniref:hypothetical protein n=1 Tax=Sorangium sp. So ce145 TaxID=3133285 RepID=UPI003F61D45F